MEGVERMQFYDTYDSPIGLIKIKEYDGYIISIGIDSTKELSNEVQNATINIVLAKTQLEEYFAGKRREFSFPIKATGTSFQEDVWHSLQKIPYGEVWTYKDVAKAIGNQKAVRAVGMANNKNPLMIVVPCHRVIGSNGKLVGYAGGLGVKQHLLELERKYKYV